MGGHGALSGVAVAGDFHKHGAHAGSELRAEDEVEDLGTLRLGVGTQQHRGRTAAVHGSDAIELFAAGTCTQLNCLCRGICPCEGQKRTK